MENIQHIVTDILKETSRKLEILQSELEATEDRETRKVIF